jgi:exopolyphosphatase / guanosine-5'-triphosphate,3'-diphosphate pyrophosphatase
MIPVLEGGVIKKTKAKKKGQKKVVRPKGSARRKKSARKIASIDVGSNGIRMAICEVQKNSQLRTVFTTRAGVRLGRDVFRDGYIREPTARKALRAFLKFKKILKKFKVTDYRAVATSAVRDSLNGREFTRYLKEKSGFDLHVISGEKEGRLIHTAVSTKFNLINSVVLLIDIGGGSVELTVSRFGRIVAVETFPIGAFRLVNQKDMYLGQSKYKIIEKLLSQKSVAMGKFLKQALGSSSQFTFVGTGGNIESLGDLRMKILGKHSNSRMSAMELQSLCKLLCRLSYDERISKLDLRPDRADVIVPGALALKLVMKLSKAKQILIPHVGLKDGVVIEVARSLST